MSKVYSGAEGHEEFFRELIRGEAVGYDEPEPEPRRTFFERTEPFMRGILRFVFLLGLALAAIQIAMWQGWWV